MKGSCLNDITKKPVESLKQGVHNWLSTPEVKPFLKQFMQGGALILLDRQIIMDCLQARHTAVKKVDITMILQGTWQSTSQSLYTKPVL